MNGSPEELEKRIQAAQQVLAQMDRALASAKKLLDETRLLLDEARADRPDDTTD